MKSITVFSCLIAMALCLVNLTQGELFHVNDVTVETKTNNFRCDRIICPPHTHRCVVTKKTKSKDLTKVSRKNVCLSAKNAVLQKSKTEETVNDGKQLYFHLDIEHSGKVHAMTSTKPSVFQKLKKTVVDKVQAVKNKF
ncbi:uncharacterized protein LOC101889379 [Musca domestica]|uniref:Uncharacterized protein LOC101889379 n=1 Tax=Musca domestica TaxID=7370 RepID=A0A1I8MQ20_MUSDO|nr:uncharacterized protein LOC101889379 [Musca domestica]